MDNLTWKRFAGLFLVWLFLLAVIEFMYATRYVTTTERIVIFRDGVPLEPEPDAPAP